MSAKRREWLAYSREIGKRIRSNKLSVDIDSKHAFALIIISLNMVGRSETGEYRVWP